MSPSDFFATHPVFTYEEFAVFLDREKPRSAKTRQALLAYHQKRGRIVGVRRGLYAVVPLGVDPNTCPVDAYLLAGKITEDAVLGYHTALELHGKAYSVFQEFRFLTGRATRPLTFRSYRFQPVRFPASLVATRKQEFAVQEMDRSGIAVRVTTLERTLVDVVDRPDLGGGWEEIWRSLEMVEYFNLEQVVNYALLLDNSTTVAKVGFFLEQHKDRLMVEERHLTPLRARKPRKPHYLERGREGGRLVSAWNLVVPAPLLERSWAEVT